MILLFAGCLTANLSASVLQAVWRFAIVTRWGPVTRSPDSRETGMPNVYIEARPKGRQEGSAVEDFVVEDHADQVLAAFKTQLDPDR
jgi:hypothetical protein